MITKVFHPVFSSASRCKDITLHAMVTTDHATHTATMDFKQDGLHGRLLIERGRDYTPNQVAAVTGLLVYHYPMVKKAIEDFMAAHNFPINDKGTVRVDKNCNVISYYYYHKE